MAAMKKGDTLASTLDNVRTSKLSESEAAAAFSGAESTRGYLPGDPRGEGAGQDVAPGGDPGELPEWMKIPAGLKFPTGRVVSFIRFKAEWTDTPGKGDRTCAMWNLNGADEKLAYSRTRGDSMKLVTELSKQTIRVVDGLKSNWTGVGPGSVDRWFDDIGAKCRQMITNHYLKTHTMTTEERETFLDCCIVTRTAG